jgi:hypothetical protein
MRKLATLLSVSAGFVALWSPGLFCLLAKVVVKCPKLVTRNFLSLQRREICYGLTTMARKNCEQLQITTINIRDRLIDTQYCQLGMVALQHPNSFGPCQFQEAI